MNEKASFIPKSSLSSNHVPRRGRSVFLVLSFLIFILSAALWGGLYMYKNYLKDNINQLDEKIRTQKTSFEIPTVKEISDFSEKISVAKNLLAGHKAVSNVLDFLQDFTMRDVRFNDLSFSFTDTGEPTLTLSGATRSYASLASQIQNLEKYDQVEQVSVSGLTSDTNGAVRFNLKISLNPAILTYTFK